MINSILRLAAVGVLIVPFAIALTACATRAADTSGIPVRSFLEGVLTVSEEIDDSGDYSDFTVLVVHQSTSSIDTLGIATSDATGAFRMDITAPDRGIYPLVILRHGQTLHIDRIVIADGDSAVLRAQFPLTSRSVRIRSQENAAMMALENSRAQSSASLMEMLQEGEYDPERARGTVMQTATLMWQLQETFPGTIGAEMAAAESVTMLEGWDDDLILARGPTIGPANPHFLDVARVVRRVTTRLEGQQAGLRMLSSFRDLVSDDDVNLQAALDAEVVIAYTDSLDRDRALAAARNLKSSYPGTVWAEWADRAAYELDHLLPGMEAPELAATTIEGEAFDLGRLRGRYVVLEFFVPGDQTFERQLPMRRMLSEATAGEAEFVSVMIERSAVRRDAYREGRELPGVVIPADNLRDPIVARYNVYILPTRVLIDPDGRIVGKYVGEAFNLLQDDLLERL
jgi:hypothetical protein